MFKYVWKNQKALQPLVLIRLLILQILWGLLSFKFFFLLCSHRCKLFCPTMQQNEICSPHSHIFLLTWIFLFLFAFMILIGMKLQILKWESANKSKYIHISIYIPKIYLNSDLFIYLHHGEIFIDAPILFWFEWSWSVYNSFCLTKLACIMHEQK